MDHSFQPSIGNPDKCAHCKYDALAHTDKAVCESCPNIGIVRPVFGGILMCEDCIAKETAAQLENMSTVAQESRVDKLNLAIEQSRLIDDKIQVSSDIFNAETVSIIELKAAIDVDESIVNKPYALAEETLRRFNHYKELIFDKSQEITELGNKQKAIHIYLNQLKNQLTEIEREKLRLKNIDYKPSPPTKAKPTTIKVSKKVDKAELQKFASEIGISVFNLQAMAVSKGISVEAAANLIKKTIADAKASINKS